MYLGVQSHDHKDIIMQKAQDKLQEMQNPDELDSGEKTAEVIGVTAELLKRQKPGKYRQ